MHRNRLKTLKQLSQTALAALILSVAVTDGAAATYKLYINKAQDDNNYVVLDGDLTASVLHTAEGMELTIPGIEVQMRCKPVEEGECTIGLSPITSAPSPAEPPPPADPDPSEEECVVSSWNPCDGQTPVDPAPPAPPPPPTPSGGNGNCVSDALIDCTVLDYGSGGSYASRPTQRIEIGVGRVLVNPFTVVPGNYTGAVQVVPTSVELPQNGARPKMWFSATPNGEPISPNCAKALINFEQSIKWEQTGAKPARCQLANQAGDYFLNIAVCISSPTDKTCSDVNNRKWAERAAVLYIAGEVNR